jgi:hypothetical protein
VVRPAARQRWSHVTHRRRCSRYPGSMAPADSVLGSRAARPGGVQSVPTVEFARSAGAYSVATLQPGRRRAR